MSHGHTRVASKGACIYCRRVGIPLTDEHIVPLSLGGQHILTKASCLDCANITKKFEQQVMRDLWGDARISYDAPSRRKKQRKTHITLPQSKDSTNLLHIPYNEYPAPMIFYKMPPSGYIQGLEEGTDISKTWELIAIIDKERRKKFLSKYPNQLTAQFRHVPFSFGKLLAKIGYGNALCYLDPDDFSPICLPYIMGEKQNVSYVVGSNFDTEPPKTNIGYMLRTEGFGNLNKFTIVSEVKLLANNHTPVYRVIVGEVFGQEQINKVLYKLGPGDLIINP